MSTIITLILLGIIVYACHKNGFTKSENSKVLGGVCAGIAARFKLNIALVRVLTVLVGLISGGFTVAVYVLLWISLPKKN